MKNNWMRLVFSISIFFLTEVLLTLAGTDDLADYSEYLNDRYRHCAIAYRIW